MQVLFLYFGKDTGVKSEASHAHRLVALKAEHSAEKNIPQAGRGLGINLLVVIESFETNLRSLG